MFSFGIIHNSHDTEHAIENLVSNSIRMQNRVVSNYLQCIGGIEDGIDKLLHKIESKPPASVRFWPEIMLQEQLLQEKLL